MNTAELSRLLDRVKTGRVTVAKAVKLLRDMPIRNLGHTRVDTQRELRVGFPEVIYSAGKTVPQIKDIFTCMLKGTANILATRATPEMYRAVRRICPGAVFNPTARTISFVRRKGPKPLTRIAVVTAGTSDIPVAEEAAVTAEVFGNQVDRVFDVGVAGIHRLVDRLDVIRAARVLVVVAGMEGALASVVAGLVDKPVIAVPTSVGYGASFGGLSALLGMLTSCAGGVSVVNIDNGFGAGYVASMINRL